MNPLAILFRVGCTFLVMGLGLQSVWSQNEFQKQSRVRQTKQYLVDGYIRTDKGHPIPNLTIEAFSKRVGRRAYFLGKSKATKRGYYSINYTSKVSESMKENGIDLFIRAYYSKKKILAQSGLLVNAPQKSRLNLTIPDSP